jgi:DNA-directed RNA polymerase subunit A'
MTDFSRLPNKEKINGREVFSMIIPQNFNFKGESKAVDENGENGVLIKDGILLKGIMDEKNLGKGMGLMLRNMHEKYGEHAALEILGKMFKLGIKVLLKYGFTTAISDTDLPEKARIMIKDILNKTHDEVSTLINLYHQRKLEIFPGRTMNETLELKILELLNKARNETGKIVQEYCSKKTYTIIMADSGARGNYLNLAQMAAVVGQQAMRGKRIGNGYDGRTLSSFKKGDLSSEARGFIANGFKSGLNPYEFFFGSMTGRDSLMDTALRTPKSGYLYRRLANAMQDLKVEYDGTVREASGKIVQFSYGEDNIDVSRSENGQINVQRIIDSV